MVARDVAPGSPSLHAPVVRRRAVGKRAAGCSPASTTTRVVRARPRRRTSGAAGRRAAGRAARAYAARQRRALALWCASRRPRGGQARRGTSVRIRSPETVACADAWSRARRTRSPTTWSPSGRSSRRWPRSQRPSTMRCAGATASRTRRRTYFAQRAWRGAEHCGAGAGGADQPAAGRLSPQPRLPRRAGLPLLSGAARRRAGVRAGPLRRAVLRPAPPPAPGGVALADRSPRRAPGDHRADLGLDVALDGRLARAAVLLAPDQRDLGARARRAGRRASRA